MPAPFPYSAFQAIKDLVTSRECLTTIDHDNMEDNQIFVACDTSDLCSGAVLSYGKTLETARPVAFESQPFRGAELNYPVHEKELLAIVRALQKWRVDLIGVPFRVYTDHKTLVNFLKQRDLSRRQARWQEHLSQYDFDITYIAGEDNNPADAMSRMPTVVPAETVGAVWVAATALARRPPPNTSVSTFALDDAWLDQVREAYRRDWFARRLADSLWTASQKERFGAAAKGVDALTALRNGWLEDARAFGAECRNALLYTSGRLVIPRDTALREQLFRLAHDSLGHYGGEKSYAALRASYYWPNMRRELEDLYIPTCEQCQRNKSSTRRAAGPLHPLPVPDGRCESVAIDFIGPLPDDGGYNSIVTLTCRLGSEFRCLPTRTDITAEDFALLFFTHWYCENGLPIDIVSDRDKLFMSKFWRALTRLTGIKLKMSTAFHPQTDGASERTNRTVIQALRFHVERNQTGWVRALPLVRFNYMNTVNASTGLSPFHLRFGHSPRMIPPVEHAPTTDIDATQAATLVSRMECDLMEAQDNLVLAKVNQAHQANTTRGAETPYKVGDKVLLSTFHRRRDYMQRGSNRVAKFMVRYDGPYTVVQAWPDTSVYTLDLPAHMRAFPTFHASLLRPFKPNDNTLFPGREHAEPGPIATPDGPEHVVEKILDRRTVGRGFQYLVRWAGYGPEHDEWLAGSKVNDLQALDTFLQDNGFVDVVLD